MIRPEDTFAAKGIDKHLRGLPDPEREKTLLAIKKAAQQRAELGKNIMSLINICYPASIPRFVVSKATLGLIRPYPRVREAKIPLALGTYERDEHHINVQTELHATINASSSIDRKEGRFTARIYAMTSERSQIDIDTVHKNQTSSVTLTGSTIEGQSSLTDLVLRDYVNGNGLQEVNPGDPFWEEISGLIRGGFLRNSAARRSGSDASIGGGTIAGFDAATLGAITGQ